MSRLIVHWLAWLLCLISLNGRVSADVVLDWNDVALVATEEDPVQSTPTFGSRALAMVQVAVYDAINAIIPKREPYALHSYCPPPGASPEAAASQAAYLVLLYLFPDQSSLFKSELKRQLALVTNAQARQRGIQVGTAAAQAIIRLRANDGAYRTVYYQPGYRPGQWRPTPPDYTPAQWPQWPYVRPFILRTGAQFRPGPPPSLGSEEYARAFNEVKRLGELNSPYRTPDQTRIGYFWSYDLPPADPPPVHFNEILQVIAIQQRNTLTQNAYLFAIVNLGLADAAIAAWDSKYRYNFWRPVTGIRLASMDYNPLTRPDPDWWPLGPPEEPMWTPPFPSYVSGHATFGGTEFRLLQLYYRTDKITFTVESRDLPDQPRTYTSFSQADQEVADSRVYLGAHWRFDETAGQNLGHQIAEYDFTHALLPRQHCDEP